MAFIKESVIKKYSVLLPYIGGTISLLTLVLQAALDNQIIPLEYHLIVSSMAIPMLAHFGRKLKQTPDGEDVEEKDATT